MTVKPRVFLHPDTIDQIALTMSKHLASRTTATGGNPDILEAVDLILTEVARIRREIGDVVADADMFQRINAEACDLLDGMGARWPDHADRLKRVAAWAIVSMVFGEEG